MVDTMLEDQETQAQETDDQEKELRRLRAIARANGIKYGGMGVEELEEAIAEAKAQKAIEEAVPSEEPELSEAGLEAVVKKMGKATAEKLHKAPKERVIIDFDPLNPKDKWAWVGINGWNFRIQRGVPHTLPIPVIELLENAKSPSYSVKRAR